ncbi:hypothetical protein FGADI_2320 [Fusarium gaditjirri]|uniref:Uncharacterized protein n=1 Tax=Fusarium gaditjirri TaxID=282569 RepID=A0A8H4X253_9HYPO|nr:hypothetical protein FGADI_2320 [Fusarium gaditjirri]
MNESQPPKRPQQGIGSGRPKKRRDGEEKAPPSDMSLPTTQSYLEERPPITMNKMNEIIRPGPAVEFANRRPEIEEEAMKRYAANPAQSDRDFRPAERQPSSSPAFSPRRDSNPTNEIPFRRSGLSHPDGDAQRASEDSEQSDDSFLPDDGGLGNDFTNQAEVPPRGSTSSPGGPRDARPLLSQFMAGDGIAQVRRDVAGLTEQLRTEKTERARLIEDVKTQQGQAIETMKRQHAQAIIDLKNEYDGSIQGLRAEHDSSLQALTSAHAETLKGMETKNDRMKQTVSAQADLIGDLRTRTEAQALTFSSELESTQSDINDLRARLETHETATEGLLARFAKRFNEVQAKQSETQRQLKEQADLIKALQEDRMSGHGSGSTRTGADANTNSC